MARPSYDKAAEQALLASCLIAPKAYDAATAAGVTQAMFAANPAHGLAFEAIGALREKGEPHDVVTVAAWLTAHYDVPAHFSLTWGQWLTSLTASPNYVSANAKTYAAVVVDDTHRRQVVSTLGDIYEGSMNGAYPATRERLERLAADIASWDTTGDTDQWAPIDLADNLAGTPLETPTILTRTDGASLLYHGRINTISGHPESGKTWFAYAATAELAATEQHVVIIDLEDNAVGTARRLTALGLTPDQLAFVHYYAPDADLAGAQAAIGRLNVTIALISIDSATRAIVNSGGATNATDDNANFGRRLRQLARTFDAAILYTDHLGKNDQPGDRYARGSGDKLAVIDGAAYKTDTIRRIGPGRDGEIKLVCVKDRHGGVLQTTETDVAAHLHMTADDDGANVALTLQPPPDTTTTDTGEFRPTGYMERLSRALEIHPQGLGKREVRNLIPGKNTYIDAAIRALHTEQHLEIIPGAHGARLHRITNPYREHQNTPPPAQTDADEPF